MGEGGGGRGRRESSSVLSLFRFHLFPFPPETPDTQAKEGDNLCTMLQSVCCLFHAKSCRLSDREKSDVLLII